MAFSEIDEKYLCNFDGNKYLFDYGNEVQELFTPGSRTTAVLRNLLRTNLEVDKLLEVINETNDDTNYELVSIASTCLLVFCEINWTKSREDDGLSELPAWDAAKDIVPSLKLQTGEEDVDCNIGGLQYFLIAKCLFEALYKSKDNVINTWWLLRCKVIHQRILDDNSVSIKSEIDNLTAKLTNYSALLTDFPLLQVLLHVELGQAHLLYGVIEKAEWHLNKAKEISGLSLELQGFLGKRTKFQQQEVAQLALVSRQAAGARRLPAEATHGAGPLPCELALNDDVRLNRIQYSKGANMRKISLNSHDQMLCLLTVQYLQRSQPKDNLADEELLPYISALLAQNYGPWSNRVQTLLMKCKLDASNKRTVERAMMQCEALVMQQDMSTNIARLSYLWASGLKPFWTWKRQLADLYCSLGLMKAALELYLQLGSWEDVIACYTVLQLRHKAAEIIHQQIELNPTPKLYCLLGDATDDVSCYEKAWEYSEQRSSRAQRHWGNHLFGKQQYAECIPHYQKSLELNYLQPSIWLRLGYAALVMENWEVSATAYRKYTHLEPNTFEAWNNLAKVYVQQGDKPRAYKALMEALKFNYDNWKLWENVVAVSMDTGHLEEVVRGYHRLLDLRGKHLDLELLGVLVRVIVTDAPDADGNPSRRLHKKVLELFGRITSVHPNDSQLWQLYADISPTTLLRGQRLQKAYKGITQDGNWKNSPDTCERVIHLADSIAEYSVQAARETQEAMRQQAEQQLASARLTAQAVLRAAETQAWPQCEQSLERLRQSFQQLMDYLQSRQ